MTPLLRLVRGDELGAALGAFSDAIAAVDGVAPFNEETLLRPEARTGVVIDGEDAPLALALGHHLDDRSFEAELAVAPEARRAGLGRTLAEQLVEIARQQPLSVWAHGDLPGARALADRLGFTAVRTLCVLEKPLDGELPDPQPAAGTRIRAFDPATDADAWVALNARAFADHPEQGRLQRADLDARMQQSWFRADDFLVLVDEQERLIGYNWCKVIESDAGIDEAEIYVIGIDPEAAGAGHGTALMRAGMQHLRERGADSVILYVDGGNERAVSLYRHLGFSNRAVDVQYRNR